MLLMFLSSIAISWVVCAIQTLFCTQDNVCIAQTTLLMAIELQDVNSLIGRCLNLSATEQTQLSQLAVQTCCNIMQEYVSECAGAR